MLGYIRKNADSWLVKALLALIAVVFIFFFGSGALTSARSELIAEVNGEAIREQEVNRQWRQAVRYQQQFNPNMTEPQRLQIRSEVIDDIIERRLMIQAADDEGIVASPKQLRRAVLEDKSFQDDEGNYSPEKYEEYLGDQPARTQARLQTFYYEKIVVQSLERLIAAAVQVAETEVKDAWGKENSKRDVEFVRVSTSLFKDEIEASDEELDAWIADNGEAIRERYDRDFDRKYNKPQKVQARHILIKFAEDDDEPARQSVRDRMAAILVEARTEGVDFAQLAAKYSEDTSATRGGDLGFFDSKRMVKEFSDTAFSMEIGEISDLVETRYGLHIIRVEAIQEEQIQALAEVEREIAADVFKDDKAPERAREFAASLVGVLDGTMDEAAATALLESRHLEIQETGEFDGRSRSVPKLGRAPEAVTAAFALGAPGAVTPEPIEIPNGFVLLRLKTATEPDLALYDEEKGAVRDRLLRTRQTRALEAYKAELKSSATIRVAPGA